MRREDLRVLVRVNGAFVYREVTDGELRQMSGLVEALTACDSCDGSGDKDCPSAEVDSTHECDGLVCPACDGTGINPHIRHRLLTRLLDGDRSDLIGRAVDHGMGRIEDYSIEAETAAVSAAAFVLDTLAGGSDVSP